MPFKGMRKKNKILTRNSMMLALVYFHIGFIIDSMKDILSSDRPYFYRVVSQFEQT